MTDISPLPLENLERARLAMRRMLARSGLFILIGLSISLFLAEMNSTLFPPYGFYIQGMAPYDIAMLLTLAALLLVLRVGIGVMKEELQEPILGLFSAPTVLLQRAHASGYRPTGFYGPFRPVQKKSTSKR